MAKTKTTKSKKAEEKVETITVRKCESQSLWVVRDSIEVTISEYPELEGKSLDEIKAYIEENSWDMAAPSNCTWADSLGDALEQCDVIREKDCGTETSILFE